MRPDLTTVWSRIRQHEGEGFQLIRGDVFTYEMFDNFLRPVGLVRHLSGTNFGTSPRDHRSLGRPVRQATAR